MAIKPTFDYLLGELLMHKHSSDDIVTYVPLTITSFTNTTNQAEHGSTVTGTTLNWTYSASTNPVTAQSINQGVGSIPVGILTKVLSGLSITSNFTWQLSATNGTESPTANTTIYFRDKRHWGVNTDDSLTSAEILTLDNNELSTARTQTRTFDCTGGRYIWFAWPVSWGQPQIYVGGFLTNFIEDTVNHTNASGYTIDYYTYRSPYLYNTANITVQVT